jgi:hypothetical protein
MPPIGVPDADRIWADKHRQKWRNCMRTVLLGMVAAAGIALAGASASLAAPVNGSVITGQAATENLVVYVRHCRWSYWRRHCRRHHYWRWSRRR